MPSAPPLRTTPQRGTCRAIFAVTGVVDEVNDLIQPGAFTATLAKRPVKTVWHHEWKDPVGVVLDIAEWQPGDRRFAEIPDWPAEAGALVATVAFNLRTSRGRDVYEQVKQWHEHGQAQFSIGYRVPASGATRRSDSVRIIHTLDLFEVSPVLHGAHPMTRSLEVKADPATSGMEHKETRTPVLEVKAAEQQINRGVMVALYPPAAIAERIAHDSGTPAEHLHITLAYLGDADQLPGHPDDLTHLVQMAIADAQPLRGSIGGIGRFPDHGNGIPTWVPVDVPGLAELRQRIAERLAQQYGKAVRDDHGFTPHLTLGYDLPPLPDVPSLPVDFPAVHVVRGADRIPIWLTGPTAEHTDPGAPDPVQQLAAALGAGEEKSARAVVAAARARLIEHKSARAMVAEAKSRIPPQEIPVTFPQLLAESYEQFRIRLADSVRDLLGQDDQTWTCIEGTYPDRVIVSVATDGPEPNSTYSVPYQAINGAITLGTPEPVELATVVVPEGSSGHRAATGAEDVDARVVQPTVEALADATARISATTADPEQLEEVRATVRGLVAALSAKGLDMEPPPKRSEPDGPTGMALWDEYTFADDEDEEAPGSDDNAPDEPDPADDDADDTEEEADPADTVRMDAEEVKALLASFRG
ncbi:2'-5' RNA ligase family protein [Streptomyces sp. NPDC048258]|uniref:2'-5' RNA ligase family protein n=1 Tax=Streptomyces sp. NPDC048258 TaxID=3365527 RepID=UPI00371608D5